MDRSITLWTGAPVFQLKSAGTKVSYFFFPVKVHILHIFGKNRMNEWKCCVFFSRRRKKKHRSQLEWMNDIWTFSGGKKKPQKKHKNVEKIACVFFFRFAGRKKNHKILGFEWMMTQKKYGTLVFFYTIKTQTPLYWAWILYLRTLF